MSPTPPVSTPYIPNKGWDAPKPAQVPAPDDRPDCIDCKNHAPTLDDCPEVCRQCVRQADRTGQWMPLFVHKNLVELALVPKDEPLIRVEGLNPPNPLDIQVGGGHYKDMAIQPVVFIEANKLGFCVGNVIKYVCRADKKNGIQDLEKARHYLDILISQKGKEKQ